MPVFGEFARLAQLVERRHDMADVVGSSPTVSTTSENDFLSLQKMPDRPFFHLISLNLYLVR